MSSAFFIGCSLIREVVSLMAIRIQSSLCCADRGIHDHLAGAQRKRYRLKGFSVICYNTDYRKDDAMKLKRTITGLVAAGCLFFSAADAAAYTDEPEGFGDMHWGDSAKKVSERYATQYLEDTLGGGALYAVNFTDFTEQMGIRGIRPLRRTRRIWRRGAARPMRKTMIRHCGGERRPASMCRKSWKACSYASWTRKKWQRRCRRNK